MRAVRKIFAVLGGMVIALSVLQMPVVFAAGTTIIPSYANGTDCNKKMDEVEAAASNSVDSGEEGMSSSEVLNAYLSEDSALLNDVIGCAIKTGRFHFYLIPYIIKYLAEFGIAIAGTVSMLFIVIGGFQYLTGPVTQNKEQGKKTITYALVGLVLTLAAWVIVNVVQVFVTS